jgi:hypothetical protein
MNQPTTRLIPSPSGGTSDKPKRKPTTLIRSSGACTPDQPNKRVPVTRGILAELDRPGNVPLRPEYLGSLGYPGPLTGLPEGRAYVELARVVYETPEPTVAQVKAVQRAASRLEAAGRIERYRGSNGVVVRRIPTDADYEYRAEVERLAREFKAARAEAKANAIPYPVDTGYGIASVMVEPVLVIGADGVEVRQPQERGREHGRLARLARLLGSRGRG